MDGPGRRSKSAHSRSRSKADRPIPACAEAVAVITEDPDQPVVLNYGEQAVQVWRVAENRGDEDGHGLVGDLGGDLREIEVQIVQPNVRKDWLHAILDDRCDRGWETDGAHQYLAIIFPTKALPYRSEHYQVCRGSTVDHVATADVEFAAELIFKAGDLLAGRQPLPVQEGVDGRANLSTIEIGAAV